MAALVGHRAVGWSFTEALQCGGIEVSKQTNSGTMSEMIQDIELREKQVASPLQVRPL